ncbi:MAG: DUF4406 domain-containing protein [Bacteroidetes bacterium]|nr:DUF4406 domain-containing protein [Bacteroidota bacterium]
MRLYLCGPISKNEKYMEEFSQTADMLLQAGHHVFNPAAMFNSKDVNWQAAMRIDIIQMLQCDGVAIVHTDCPSSGQALEMLIANQVGIECKSASEWLS